MKVKHYFVFSGDKQKSGKLDETMWGTLRTDNDNPSFRVEENIAQYEENCRKELGFKNRAYKVKKVLDRLGCKRIISFGCGKGILEWYLKKAGNYDLTCSDYAEPGLVRLKEVFPSCDSFLRFDLLHGSTEDISSYDAAIMHRISTEFDTSEWRMVFENMNRAGIKYIIYIPTEVASTRFVLREIYLHVKNRLLGRKDVMCGYCYTKEEFPKFWKDFYTVDSAYRIEKDNVMYILRMVENGQE